MSILLISDLLFPVWWAGILVFCLKKGLPFWKAWGIAGSFCLGQAYLVAKLVGSNLGGYFLVFVTALPGYFFEMISGKGKLTSYSGDYWIWITPPLVLVVLPMLAGYFIRRRRLRK